MPKIPSLKRRQLIRRLKNFDFEGPFAGGKHSYMKRENFRLTIPNPHGKEIDGLFIRELLKQAGIDVKEWLTKRKK